MRFFFRVFAAATLTAAFAGLLGAAHAQTVSASPGSTSANAQTATILVVGDSLSSEYGIGRDTGWVSLMARRVSKQYPKYRVINASISGDTTSGGAARLPALLSRDKPAIVVLELGSNDALRGLSMQMTERNLRTMTRAIQQAGARPVLIGMQIPPNYGRAYTEQFKQVFGKVAQSENAALVPFLMEGIALDRDMFQSDGIHPNEGAQDRLLDNVWPVVEPLLKG